MQSGLASLVQAESKIRSRRNRLPTGNGGINRELWPGRVPLMGFPSAGSSELNEPHSQYRENVVFSQKGNGKAGGMPLPGSREGRAWERHSTPHPVPVTPASSRGSLTDWEARAGLALGSLQCDPRHISKSTSNFCQRLSQLPWNTRRRVLG